MSTREIIFRVYFKCGEHYEFVTEDGTETFDSNLSRYWDKAALWCSGVCLDTTGWLHSIITHNPWIPNVNDNENEIPCNPTPGYLYRNDQPDSFEVDAAYVLVLDSGKEEVIVQYKDDKLTRLDDPLVRFVNKLTTTF